MRTVFENDVIKVQVDESKDEVFVENKGRQNPEMIARVLIGTGGLVNRLTVTSLDSVWEPGVFNGDCGFSVSRKKG